MSKVCQRPGCERGCYGDFCLLHKPRKTIPKMSAKEARYQIWLKTTAKPNLIDKHGHRCVCCGREDLPLDLEHKLNKGSHPELKRVVDNFQLMCRSCHIEKTNNRECLHG